MTNREKKLIVLLGATIAFFIFSKTKYGATMTAKILDATVNLLKQFEGFSPVAYADATGHSIGYGHFILPGEKFTGPIDETQAAIILAKDLEKANKAVDRYVKVPLTSNQRSALISFVFNIGEGNFKTSTAVKRLNALDYKGAADAMLWFNKSRDSAGNLKVNNALVDRRVAERELFLTA